MTQTRTQQYAHLINRRMAEKLIARQAVDISDCPRQGNYYVLDRVIDGKDYCDAALEAWVWSIGRRISDGVILASLSAELYENPDFDCLWLR